MQGGVACARLDNFEGGAQPVGAGTAPHRRCTGAAWRPGRRGRRARLRAIAAVAWAWAGEALLGQTRGGRASGGREGRPSRLRPWAEKLGRRPAKEMKQFSF